MKLRTKTTTQAADWLCERSARRNVLVAFKAGQEPLRPSRQTA
jgi:hypothetical protein